MVIHVSFSAESRICEVGVYFNRFGLSGFRSFVTNIPSLRISGDYLAIATFGSGVIVYSIAKNWTTVTRGPMGLPGIPGFSVFGMQLSGVWTYLILVAVFVSLTYFALRRIVNSPFGRILRGIREDEGRLK